MAGYSDTRQMIIDTLMGRPAGTEIQPEDHQAFALQITDYVRSVELVAGNATPIDFADASTVPVQPDNGQALYLSQVGRGTTVVFTNFIDQNGDAISVTSDSNSVILVNLLWNGQYWTKQETRISLENTIQENDIADGAVTSKKIADGAVTVNKIADRSILGSKIVSGTITAEKLNPDWRKNLAHKAVVYDYNVNKPDDVPQLVQAYKADANQSAFLVYRSGMYYPAALMTQQDNEAIIFYQPEGVNFLKVIIRKSGSKETKVYGSPAVYEVNGLSPNEKIKGRQNLGIKIYGDLTEYNIFTAGEMKGAVVFEAPELMTKGVYFENTKISLYLPGVIYIDKTQNLKSVSYLSSAALNAIDEKVTAEFPDSTGEIKAAYCKGWIRNFIVDDNIDDIVVVVKGNKTYSFGF